MPNKDMHFWELAPSSMVHMLGRLLALLDLFFLCNPTFYGLGVERELFGGLGIYMLFSREKCSSLYFLVNSSSFADGLQDDTLVFVDFFKLHYTTHDSRDFT